MFEVHQLHKGKQQMVFLCFSFCRWRHNQLQYAFIAHTAYPIGIVRISQSFAIYFVCDNINGRSCKKRMTDPCGRYLCVIFGTCPTNLPKTFMWHTWLPIPLLNLQSILCFWWIWLVTMWYLWLITTEALTITPKSDGRIWSVSGSLEEANLNTIAFNHPCNACLHSV